MTRTDHGGTDSRRRQMVIGLCDTLSGDQSDLPVQGMFAAIGYRPNTHLFTGQLNPDDHGYLEVVETGSNRRRLPRPPLPPRGHRRRGWR